MHILKYRYLYFILPAILLVASIITIATLGLKPGVDLQGGSLMEVSYEEERPSVESVNEALAEIGMDELRVQPAGEDSFLIRSRELSDEEKSRVIETIALDKTVTLERSTTIGATIGDELRAKGWVAIFFVSLTVLLYIAFVFRNVRGPDGAQIDGVPSWKYGSVAIFTLLHDIIIPTDFLLFLVPHAEQR